MQIVWSFNIIQLNSELLNNQYRIFQEVIKELAGNEKNSLEYDFENWGADK